MNDQETQLTTLRETIRTSDYHYYVLNQPSISDFDYDQLLLKLTAMEKAWPNFASSDSPSQRFGSDQSSDFAEVKHTIPVLSLDKAYSVAEILTWVKRSSASLKAKSLAQDFSCILEEKIDGLSIVLYYEQGQLVRGVTRGNGEQGNDVSANVRTIREVPLRLSRPISGAFRGEVYLSKPDFQRLNSQQELSYANPRNLAGGTLRRIKSSEVAKVPLRIFIYEGFYQEAPQTHQLMLEDLKQLGFKTNPSTAVFSLPRQAEQLADEIKQRAAGRGHLDYEIDGLVFKINELELREPLGYTEHHPRWALAYKFDNPQGQSSLLAIDIQVGRSGRITPVARIEPVLVGGATIQNVTLHNQDYINALDLGIGDSIVVSRRGDVIPAIESVSEKKSSAAWQIPELCPSCASKLHKQGAHHFCLNFACPQRSLGRLIFFAGRDQMDIDGLGSESMQFLWQQGFVRDIPDLYTFDYQQLDAFAGWGQKKIVKLQNSLESSKQQSFARVLVSLGLSDLGPRMARLLINAGFLSMQSLFDLADRGQSSQLSSLHGLGEVTAQTLLDQLKEQRLRDMVARLRDCGLCFEQALAELASETLAAHGDPPLAFSGQTWCATGTFENFKPRSLALELIVKHGGTASEDLNKTVSHLLLGEKAGSKLAKAQAWDIAIVTESEFLKLVFEAGLSLDLSQA